MQQFFESLRSLINDHWVKFLSAAAFTLVGWIIGRWRAARSWKNREFFNRLNISLNTLSNGRLLIRTILRAL